VYMGRVVFHMSVALDGFAAGPNDGLSAGEPHRWA